MLRELSLRLPLSLHPPRADMQSADVAISVSRCDYMLTGRRHDDQHLCRCIDEIWTASFSSAGIPALVSMWVITETSLFDFFSQFMCFSNT